MDVAVLAQLVGMGATIIGVVEDASKEEIDVMIEAEAALKM